ncbi:MAG: M67 family metallopeptidase [Candidatus Omnitrophota bacterium]
MKIKREILNRIIEHAKKCSPIEACGYLAGKEKLITKHYELANMDESQEHFSFEPGEQFRVLRDARANGLEIYAVYHSHPFSPARPSVEDIKLALDPNLSYCIVSLAGNKEEVKSFRIKAEKVENEDLEVVDNERL